MAIKKNTAKKNIKNKNSNTVTEVPVPVNDLFEVNRLDEIMESDINPYRLQNDSDGIDAQYSLIEFKERTKAFIEQIKTEDNPWGISKKGQMAVVAAAAMLNTHNGLQ